MSRLKFRWARGAMTRLRRTSDIEEAVKKIADGVASSAGEGYESSSQKGPGRARASVITATPDAMRKESKNSNLLRALNSRRV